MAPDLNSVPPSPRNAQQQPPPQSDSRRPSAPPSRRASQIYPMNPPPLPLVSPGGSIPASVQQGHVPFPPLSPGMAETGVPMRHPRPLTAAELHLELEKEQEAIVNRLTRELTALRAHSSSVASTTSISSSSTNPPLPHDPSDPTLTGPNHPAQSRSRHRSSSSVSASQRQANFTAIDPAASTPSAASRAPSISATGGPLMPTTPRYEEVLLHRQELEEAKRENERLRRRVRELEALVRGRRASSVSTREGVSGANTSERSERSVSVRRRRPEGSVEAGSTTG
ncbi:uncharacterized protein PV09_01363 [Verruconis gallopava]|uniref:Uncharacterized protein n=1 Tax=Verruconis gallopava TaxID=253628 RepID=A0A0D2APK1_9PEZI|nr:uncharacterized protein PV09_01363 [Verruconis gallopava]KIW08460.1 hypothetical protein PV09_01363 [Verruconis gallopava]